VGDHLTIDVRETDETCVLAPKGELDLASAPALVERAEAQLEGGTRALVLDLRDLAFIDSTGLGAIAGIDRAARKAGVPFSLVPGPANVQRVFEISGTSGAFSWTDAPA
jgi:anti-sigma B factor antagonist